MGRFLSRVGVLAFATTVLIVLNGILLIRDYQRVEEIMGLRSKLHDASIKIRVFESKSVFGDIFVPYFNALDLQGDYTAIPYMGSQKMLILFFTTSDCRVCLESLAEFNTSTLDVPVVGVSLFGSLSEVNKITQEFEYEFPVFRAQDTPFQLIQSPISVLIDRNRNILDLSKIEPTDIPVEEVIGRISEISERR